MKLNRSADKLMFYPERVGKFQIYNNENIMITQGDQAISLCEEENKRCVYRIEWEDQTSYLAEAYLPNTKITNFRDIGGYRNNEGRQVKYDCFYRSAPIVFPDQESRNYVERLAMKTILDFRSDHEVASTPDDTLKGCTYICKGAISSKTMEFAGNFDFKELMKSSDPKDLKAYMSVTYENLPFHNEAYQTMFDLMLADEVPLVFHCSAGKDRTGFGAYLILKTLGVDDESIMEDYLASNIYRQEDNEKMKALAVGYGDVVNQLMNVYPEYLQASMDKIFAKYPDFPTYLLEEYDIDETKIALLKHRYLYE